MAYDAFLKFEGIEGDGPDGTIPVDSFSWGAARQGGAPIGGGAATGRAVVSDVVITKVLDKSSPKLFEACATGRHFPSATLSIRSAGERSTFAFLKLSDVSVGAINITGNIHGDVFPAEQVSLSFYKYSFSFGKV